MKESVIQSAIIKALEKKGAYVVKVMQASKAGVPDLIVCYQSRLFGLEVKNETGRVTELQIYNGDLIKKAGGVWAVVRSVKEALALIDQPAPHKALATRLRAYQDWRRGGDAPQPDPTQLGKDFDEVLAILGTSAKITGQSPN